MEVEVKTMYGVPNGLDLNFLHGSELIQVCLGVHQVQFHFHPVGTIAVEGEWELLRADGSALDRSEPAPRTLPFQLHRLLGQRVTRTQVDPPTSIAVWFESGELLRVYDSSKEYESFTIQPGDIVV
jgi:hypothetical protein